MRELPLAYADGLPNSQSVAHKESYTNSKGLKSRSPYGNKREKSEQGYKAFGFHRPALARGLPAEEVKNMRKFFKENIFLVVLLFIFIMFKLSSLFRYHLLWWDEAVYIGMGKYLWSLGKAGLWEAIRPIGLPLLLGFIWKLKLNLVLFSEILELLFAAGNILMIYLIGKTLFNKKIGVLASFLLAFTPVFFNFSSFILTGMPSTFFLLLAFYFFIRKKLSFSGIFAGLCFLFRFPNILLFFSFILILIIENFRNKKLLLEKISLFSIPFIIIIFPFLILNSFLYNSTLNPIHALFFPMISAAVHQSNILNAAPGNLESLFFYPLQLLIQNPLLIFSLVGLPLFFLRKRYHSIIIILLLYLTYFTYIINKQTRFSLVFLPFVCLLSAYGISRTWKYIKKQKRVMKYVLTFFLFILLIFSFGIMCKDNKNSYVSRQSQEPEIIEFYKYFMENPANPILTTTPLPAAFGNALFIPMYDNPEEALRIYKEHRESVEAVVYTPHFYPCEPFGQECEQQKQELFDMINDDFVLELNRTYDNQQYYIFRTKGT